MKNAAFLRAVNVGGHNLVSMTALRDLFAKLGFKNAQTLLQSGNVVFDTDGKSPEQLERLLESEVAKRLKIQTDFFVRTAKQLDAVIKHNPFPREAKSDPSHLLVVFCKTTPSAADIKTLQAVIKGPELVKAWGTQAYIVYPAGMGRSKLTPALIESKLKTRGTARNWNTVLRIRAMMVASQA